MGTHDCGGSTQVLGCFDCGATCCSACAIPLESVTYCARCASSLLEAQTVRASDRVALY